MALVEREPELATIRRAMGGAARCGQVLAVTGDAGAGKTSLVRAATADATTPTRVLRGLCDPLSTPRPLGPVRDVLAQVEEAAAHADRTAGAAEAVPAPVVPAEVGPLGDIEARFVRALSTEPTTLVVEDAQWVDGASVDVLRYLVRRIETVPVLLVLTYRDVEVGPEHPLRPLLGEVARAAGTTTVALRPLSLEAVATLVERTGLDASSVHRLTGGNPFFVTEIVRHGGTLPASVRDAVLASTSGLDAADLEVLQLVATAPDAVDDRMLPLLHVDVPRLRRLEATGLLDRTRRGLAYRHELARLAVRDAIPRGAEPALHARVLEALERLGSDDVAVLTHHASAAHDRPRTTRYARLAAEEAARTGAHGESVAFFTLALESHDGAVVERARMLQRLGFEQYMVGRLDASIDSVSRAQHLWEQEGDERGIAEAHDQRALVEYYRAHRREAEQHAGLASEEADELDFGSGLATSAYLAYRRFDHEGVARRTAAARAIAERAGDEVTRARADLVDAAVELAGGQLAARGRLLVMAASALERSFDEVGTTAYSNIAAIDVEHRRFREAEEVLAVSVPITVERDIPVCNHWQTAMRSRLSFQRGRWAAGVEDARSVLGRGVPLAGTWPHLVLGLVAMRTGRPTDDASAEDHLAEAWRLAHDLDEPLVHLPVLSALAEQVWLTGAFDTRLAGAADRLEQLEGLDGLEWAVGDLALWLSRLGRPLDASSSARHRLAEPFALELGGRHAEAAQAWRALGAPYESALSAVHGADADAATRGVHDLEDLGAAATADRCRALLRARGVTRVPMRRRPSTAANPSGLTNRQLDVARLVARGLTNAELAAELFISPKTADHHVSAVLSRLGLSTRREVVQRAAELGLD